MTYQLSPHDRDLIQEALDRNDLRLLAVLLAIDDYRRSRLLDPPEWVERWQREQEGGEAA